MVPASCSQAWAAEEPAELDQVMIELARFDARINQLERVAAEAGRWRVWAESAQILQCYILVPVVIILLWTKRAPN